MNKKRWQQFIRNCCHHFVYSLEFINFVSKKYKNYEPQRHNAAAAAHKGVHEKYK